MKEQYQVGVLVIMSCITVKQLAARRVSKDFRSDEWIGKSQKEIYFNLVYFVYELPERPYLKDRIKRVVYLFE